MVQTYGIANESSLDPTAPDADESRALLGGGATGKASGLVDGRATIISCISNLLNTIIGSGACFFFEVPLFGLCSHSDTFVFGHRNAHVSAGGFAILLDTYLISNEMLL